MAKEAGALVLIVFLRVDAYLRPSFEEDRPSVGHKAADSFHPFPSHPSSQAAHPSVCVVVSV